MSPLLSDPTQLKEDDGNNENAQRLAGVKSSLRVLEDDSNGIKPDH